MTVKGNSIKFKQFICQEKAVDYQYMQNLKRETKHCSLTKFYPRF